MKNKKVLITTACLVTAACGVAFAAVSGDRLKSPVLVGQGTATTESIAFDIGSGTSNTKLQNSPTGLLGVLSNGSTPASASGAAFYVSQKDSGPQFAIERTNSNTAAFSFYAHDAELDFTGLSSNTLGLRLADTGALTTFGVLLETSSSNSVSPEIDLTQTGGAGGNVMLRGGKSGTVPAFGTTDNTDMVFTANGSESFRILGANRQVGINSTSPTSQLDVVSSGVNTLHLVHANDTVNAITINNTTFGSTPSTGFNIQQANSGNANFTNNATQGFHLNGGAGFVVDTAGESGNTPHTCVVRSASNNTGTTDVSCSTNEIATGGGCLETTSSDIINKTAPTGGSTSAPPTGWECIANVASNLTAYAVCCLY